MQTLFDKVKEILEYIPPTRDNDRYLMIKVWEMDCPEIVRKFNNKPYLDIEKFIYDLPVATSSIKRARRKVQELHPELRSKNSRVQSLRRQKQETKGDFIWSNEWK